VFLARHGRQGQGGEAAVGAEGAGGRDGRAGSGAGLALAGPDGLLKQLTKTVLKAALNAEMTEHLRHEKHQVQPGRAGSNVRKGTRSKAVVSDAVGAVEGAVPRDRASSFEPGSTTPEPPITG
jgi:transposase-like protein